MEERLVRMRGQLTCLEKMDTDDDIMRYRVSLIGSGQVDRIYGTFTIPKATLKRETPKFNDTHAFSHRVGFGMHVPTFLYQADDLLGSFKDASYEDGFVFATLELLNTQHGRDTAVQLDYAIKNKSFLGWSSVFSSDNKVKERDDGDYDVVLEKINHIFSTDIVTMPAFDTNVEQKLSVQLFDLNNPDQQFESEDARKFYESFTALRGETYHRKETDMSQEKQEVQYVTVDTFNKVNEKLEDMSTTLATALDKLENVKEDTADTDTSDTDNGTETLSADDELRKRYENEVTLMEKARLQTEARNHFEAMTGGIKFPAVFKDKLAEQFGDFSETTKEDVDRFVNPIKEALASDEVREFMGSQVKVGVDVADKGMTALQSHMQNKEIKIGDTKFHERDVRDVLNNAFNIDGNKWDGDRIAEALRKGAREFPIHEKLADEQGKSFTEYFAGTTVRTDAAVGGLLLGIMIESVAPAFNENVDLMMARKFARTVVNPDFNDRRWPHVGIWLPQEAVVEQDGEYQVMNIPDGTITPTAPEKRGAIVHLSLEQVENQPSTAMATFVTGIADSYARLEAKKIFSCVISPKPTAIGGTTAPNNLATAVQQVYPEESVTKDVKSLTGRALYWDRTASEHQANYKTQTRSASLNSAEEFFTNDRVLSGMTEMRKYQMMSDKGSLSGVRGIKAWAILCDWNDEEIVSELVNSPYKINTDSTWNQINRTLAEANGGGGVIPVTYHDNLDEIRDDTPATFRNYYALVGNPMDQDFLGVSYRYGMTPRFFADPSQVELFTRDRFRFRIDHFFKVFPINWRGFYLENVAWEQA